MKEQQTAEKVEVPKTIEDILKEMEIETNVWGDIIDPLYLSGYLDAIKIIRMKREESKDKIDEK